MYWKIIKIYLIKGKINKKIKNIPFWRSISEISGKLELVTTGIRLSAEFSVSIIYNNNNDPENKTQRQSYSIVLYIYLFYYIYLLCGTEFNIFTNVTLDLNIYWSMIKSKLA